jgi:NADH:ubiquinone oxidoreductase subunit 2 (subunit N)
MKKINQTLSELILGILISGAAIELISMFFTKGPDIVFAGSFGAGVATAILLSVHMYRSIDRALDMAPDDAQKYMRKTYLIRAAIIFLVAGIVCRIDAEDILAVFLGVLCLKFGAFLQPLVHRFTKRDET